MKIYKLGDPAKPTIMLFPAPAATGKQILDMFLKIYRNISM